MRWWVSCPWLAAPTARNATGVSWRAAQRSRESSAVSRKQRRHLWNGYEKHSSMIKNNPNFEIRKTPCGESWIALRLEDGEFIGPVDLPGHLEKLMELSDNSADCRARFRAALAKIPAGFRRKREKPCDAQRRRAAARADHERMAALVKIWEVSKPISQETLSGETYLSHTV